MAGYGTGYPNFFRCPRARRENQHWRATFDSRQATKHWVKLTGKTRPTPATGKGHPRKSWTTREWTCSCGERGWSSHTDLERIEATGHKINAS